MLDNVYKAKITRTEKSKRTSSLTKKEADNYEMEFFFRDRAGTERKTITLTASKFHGRPHPDMVNLLARHIQSFRVHNDSLRQQFLDEVCFGHPGGSIRGGVYEQVH